MTVNIQVDEVVTVTISSLTAAITANIYDLYSSELSVREIAKRVRRTKNDVYYHLYLIEHAYRKIVLRNFGLDGKAIAKRR